MCGDHGKGLCVEDFLYEYETSDMFVNENLFNSYFSSNSTAIPTSAAVAEAAELEVAATEQSQQRSYPQLEEPLPTKIDQVATGGAGKSQNKRTRSTELHKLAEKKRRVIVKDRLAQLQELIPNFKNAKTDKASILEHVIDYIKTLKNKADVVSTHGRQDNNNIGYNRVSSSIKSFLPNTHLDLDLESFLPKTDHDLDMDLVLDMDFSLGFDLDL